MRLIDADELMEHVWRDKLDCRGLIAEMVNKAPTVKEIPTKIPMSIFERLISQEPKTGHWIKEKTLHGWDGNSYQCSECGRSIHLDLEVEDLNDYPYCHCGARMTGSED